MGGCRSRGNGGGGHTCKTKKYTEKRATFATSKKLVWRRILDGVGDISKASTEARYTIAGAPTAPTRVALAIARPRLSTLHDESKTTPKQLLLRVALSFPLGTGEFMRYIISCELGDLDHNVGRSPTKGQTHNFL